jgi:hypothetical protein
VLARYSGAPLPHAPEGAPEQPTPLPLVPAPPRAAP